MTLVYFEGFDAGDFSIRPGVSAGSAVGTSTSTRFSSGRALSTAYTVSNYYWTKSLTAVSQLFMGVAFTAGSAGLNNDFFYLMGDAGATTHLTLRCPTTTSIAVYRGGTQLATATCPSISGWNYLEVSATIADSGGTCVVKVNGTSLISFTGDTKNAGTNSTIDTVRLTGTTDNSAILYDDLYLCDSAGSSPYNTFLGDVRVDTLSPTGAGSSTQWTPDSGSNYARVNEMPYSASNYVQDGTSGHRDTYALADLSGSPTVLAVQNCVIAKKTDAGAMSLKLAVKSSSTVAYGTTTALGVSDATLTDLRTTDPATSSAWVASGVNALEAGMEVA